MSKPFTPTAFNLIAPVAEAIAGPGGFPTQNEQQWRTNLGKVLQQLATTLGGIEVPKLGADVASTPGVITPTGTIFHVTGTAAITGIDVPTGWQPGMCLYIIPDDIFTWTAATNIALAGTAVVNKLIIFAWSGLKWVPSSIA